MNHNLHRGALALVVVGVAITNSNVASAITGITPVGVETSDDHSPYAFNEQPNGIAVDFNQKHNSCSGWPGYYTSGSVTWDSLSLVTAAQDDGCAYDWFHNSSASPAYQAECMNTGTSAPIVQAVVPLLSTVTNSADSVLAITASDDTYPNSIALLQGATDACGTYSGSSWSSSYLCGDGALSLGTGTALPTLSYREANLSLAASDTTGSCNTSGDSYIQWTNFGTCGFTKQVTSGTNTLCAKQVQIDYSTGDYYTMQDNGKIYAWTPSLTNATLGSLQATVTGGLEYADAGDNSGFAVATSSFGTNETNLSVGNYGVGNVTNLKFNNFACANDSHETSVFSLAFDVQGQTLYFGCIDLTNGYLPPNVYYISKYEVCVATGGTVSGSSCTCTPTAGGCVSL